jgi:hypothetical protein
VTAISYHDTVNDLQGLDWTGTGPFASLDWFTLLENAGAKPFVVLANDGAEHVALPLVRQGKNLSGLSNWYAFTFQPLCSAVAVPLQMLCAVARDLRHHADRICLTKLAESDAQQLNQAFRASGWHCRVEPCDSNHILTLSGRDYARYMADRPGPLRTTLKRKAKHCEVELFTEFQSDTWEIYERIYAKSWKPEEGDPALLKAFAQSESAKGHLRLAIARHEGTPVAAQFWTVQDNTAWIHKLAHLESAKPLSAGTILTAALMAQVIDKDGVQAIDFGTGNDPYKRDWMEQVRTRFRLTCWRPEAPRNWLPIVKSTLRNLVSPARAG